MSARGETIIRRPRALTGEHFMLGDHACAEGALAAGCNFFAGYPITPATETAERMAERLPQVGGVYVNMEDELASMAAILGAAWAGAKAMTATSGPGFSLMMENIGLGIITETPCVVVNVQRGAPATGLPTLVGQGDMMQARWGSHGSYEIIALCPSSPQELFDLTVRAFNLAERYRLPVLVMTDADVGHLTERVVIPPAERIETWERKRPTVTPEEFMTCLPDEDLIPPMPNAGEGYRVFVESLTHDEKGYPVIDAETQNKLVKRLIDKIRVHAEEIIEYEERDLEGAEVAVVSYGISARISMRAIELAREEGIRVGMLRLITAWPFPQEAIRRLATRVRGFVVPELNFGQMCYEVERCACGQAPVVLVPHGGGEVHNPRDILEAIRSVTR